MYDVIYIDGRGVEVPLARALDDRQDACAIAKRAAAERGVGRMVADSYSRPEEGFCKDTVLVLSLPDAA